jgi:phosphoribosylanthranilate isomerase
MGPEPAELVRVPVKVKVCGVTSVGDALACAEAGADWIGLNFHPASPRSVDVKTARQVIAALPPSCAAVGLFVDRAPDEVVDLAALLGLQIVQLHGHERPEDLLTLTHFQLVRAFRLRDAQSIECMSDHLRRATELGRAPDAVLIDTFVPGQTGGTGQAIAEPLLAILPPIPRLILAGGLTPENVAKSVRQVRPWMVDVASGVESSPGRKDHARVRDFIRSARGF